MQMVHPVQFFLSYKYNMPKYTIISGFNMTGKTVITDILKEFDGYNVPIHTSEFNLLRIQGGILDLYNALEEDWSPIRSDAAIRRFRKVFLKLGMNASFKKPISLFLANGANYNQFFNGMFFKITNNYVNSLIDYSYDIEWPYLAIDESPFKQFFTRVQSTFLKKKVFYREVYGTDKKDFIKKTKNYLDELFQTISTPNTKTFVMHNTIEPFNPTRGLNLFDDAKIIIVQRDPRDVYAANYVRDGAYVPTFEVKRHWELKMGLTGADKIDTFIKRQLAQYNRVKKNKDDDRVLRLRFEEIVINYEQTLQKIYNFLNIDSTVHSNKGKFFKPELSKNNIGLWKMMGDNKEIKLIEKALPDYCYQQ